ncbi:MAG: DUF6542 domain-containing protein [Candidatus Nanopelagicales bacterium]
MSNWDDPLDPAKDEAYAALFRPDEPDEPVPAPVYEAPEPAFEDSVAIELVADEPFAAENIVAKEEVIEVVAPVVAEPVVAAPAAPREPSDTGRLFRSSRAESATAIIAIRPDQASKLRTLTPAAAPSAPAPARAESGAPIPINSAAAPAAALLPPVGYEAEGTRTSRRELPRIPSIGGGFTSMAAYLFVIVVTLVAGLIDAFAFGEGLGSLTGVFLLIATVIAALRVQVQDAIVPVLAAPIAMLIAALTVGQLNLGNSGTSLTSRGVAFFFTFANNWLWIFASVIIALIVMIVRRSRSRG